MYKRNVMFNILNFTLAYVTYVKFMLGNGIK